MCLPNILFPVFMFAFIFHCGSFSPCWPLAFLILSPPLWLSMFFSYEFSITRSSSFSVIHVSVHIKKERRKRKDFFLSKSPGDHVISFQKNLELHFGSYTYWLSILHWYACGADGRSLARCTVTWLPNLLGWVDYHISLAMGLRPRARFAIIFNKTNIPHKFGGQSRSSFLKSD